MIAFGPVPSRRLGHSLGVNNIPPKHCSYACVYCQLGRTPHMQVARRRFYAPAAIARQVEAKIASARQSEETVDYLTFVPDGEPTLDANLGHEIKALKPLEIPIAVITNSSLIGREDVRRDLLQADWVSLKMDAVREDIWQRVDRPHGSLRLPEILEGALEFAHVYEGQLMTETMLVGGVNNSPAMMEDLAAFLARLQPTVAYLGIPTRLPAEAWVEPPPEAAFNRAFRVLSAALPEVEALIGYEGNAFAFTGDAAQDLLSITAVHPMRQDAVSAFLTRADADWAVVEDLLHREQLTEMSYKGHQFYLRRFNQQQHSQESSGAKGG